MKSLSNILIENDMFISHVFQKEKLNIPIQKHCIDLQEKYNIDISPYVFIVENIASTKKQNMFYVALNYYLNLNDPTTYKIKDSSDIKSMYDILCYIYMVQYFFL